MSMKSLLPFFSVFGEFAIDIQNGQERSTTERKSKKRNNGNEGNEGHTCDNGNIGIEGKRPNTRNTRETDASSPVGNETR